MTLYDVVIQHDDGRQERRVVANIEHLRADMMANLGHLNYFIEVVRSCEEPSVPPVVPAATRFEREEIV